MTEYRIVRADPTPRMQTEAAQFPTNTHKAIAAAINASPPPGEDLVERVADIVQNCHRHNGPLETARAILAEIERKT